MRVDMTHAWNGVATGQLCQHAQPYRYMVDRNSGVHDVYAEGRPEAGPSHLVPPRVDDDETVGNNLLMAASILCDGYSGAATMLKWPSDALLTKTRIVEADAILREPGPLNFGFVRPPSGCKCSNPVMAAGTCSDVTLWVYSKLENVGPVHFENNIMICGTLNVQEWQRTTSAQSAETCDAFRASLNRITLPVWAHMNRCKVLNVRIPEGLWASTPDGG